METGLTRLIKWKFDEVNQAGWIEIFRPAVCKGISSETFFISLENLDKAWSKNAEWISRRKMKVEMESQTVCDGSGQLICDVIG